MTPTAPTKDLQRRLFSRAQPLALGADARIGIWIVVLLALFMTWASWAEIDEQVRTPAKIIVSSRSQVVQAIDGGVLSVLNVREGDLVKAGDLLAVLDPSRAQASTDEIVAKSLSLKAVMQRLEAEISDRPLRFSAEIRAHPKIVSSEQRLYERRTRGLEQEINALQTGLTLAMKELDALVRLSKTGDASGSEVLKAQRETNDLQAKITNRRNAYLQEAQAELSKARGELEQTLQVLAQRQEAVASTRLYAPMSGIVNGVRHTTIGAVLKSGDELLQIVPSDEPLLVEARIPPRDVAFVRQGLDANVKLDAYDYAIYGGLAGEVVYISPDTLEEQEMRRDQEPAYRVHVRINPDQALRPSQAGERIDIIPGMTATLEIITGRRTVAQYLLKPIRRVRDNALKER
jgi:membrane fusion protein, adhesin transport system